MQLSQLRLLLEKNLPQSSGKGQTPATDSPQVQNNNVELRQVLLKRNAFMAESNNAVMQPSVGDDGSASPFVDNPTYGVDLSLEDSAEQSLEAALGASPLCFEGQQPNQPNGYRAAGADAYSQVACDETPVPEPASVVTVQTQVPASPNTRRRAFNFQPISPRSTPTIHDNNNQQLSAYAHGSLSVQPQAHHSPQVDVLHKAASQPASANNSPFMSPRSTPVQLSTRSRHDSGQSMMSVTRQTPLMATFDSGVSSVSSSPFISPQATPVPMTVHRLRTGSGPVALQRAVLTRTRHNSGPGAQLVATSFYPATRSISLSPMTDMGKDNGGHGQTISPVDSGHALGSAGSSVHSSVMNTPVNTPMSPLSEPLSPNVTYSATPDMMPVNEVVVSTTVDDWTRNTTTNTRHRHLSSPYALHNDSPQQCKQQQTTTYKLVTIRSNSISNNHSVTQPQWHDYHVASKSYPATPIRPQSFSYPPSPQSKELTSNTSTAGDVMVSSVQLAQGAEPSWSGRSAASLIRDDNIIGQVGPRRNLVELLTAPQFEEDDLQTTLDDLRDMDDNDFTRFQQELEAMDVGADLVV